MRCERVVLAHLVRCHEPVTGPSTWSPEVFPSCSAARRPGATHHRQRSCLPRDRPCNSERPADACRWLREHGDLAPHEMSSCSTPAPASSTAEPRASPARLARRSLARRSSVALRGGRRPRASWGGYPSHAGTCGDSGHRITSAVDTGAFAHGRRARALAARRDRTASWARDIAGVIHNIASTPEGSREDNPSVLRNDYDPAISRSTRDIRAPWRHRIDARR
jgi:hypothetical protein